jgi:ABC-type uncharacterized transport system substrate-binding protein
MKNILKQLWLIISLILAASVLLLVSDRGQRISHVKQSAKTYPSIAVMQITSTPVLDSHVAGVVDRLKERGWLAPDGTNIRFYNAQGDYGTANAIALDIASSPYDMVITSGTVALQVFSKANMSAQKPHVFGAITDPHGTGAGITGPEPDQHPPHMAGVGTFQPVESAIRIAHEMNPELHRLGVVWNPGEQCSEACLTKARVICDQLGIQLIEATAANTFEVSEAARAVIAKQVDAVWIGGDTVAMASTGLIVNLAGQAGIPVFTNDPMDVEKGALFGLGADYFTVGRYTADIAADILEGRQPSDFRIENIIPEQLNVNPDVLAGLKGKWKPAPSVEKFLGRQETRRRIAVSGTDKPFKLRMVLYSETEFAERCREGLINGINQAGFGEGRDYTLRIYNAQGDMSTLSSIMTSIKSDRVDLLMVVSTPALQAALRQAGEETKIVFTGVGDGVQAGAGKSDTDHLPNVTGITTRSPFDGMAKIIKETLPHARRAGTLFTPGEINSVLYKDWFAEALEKQGLELVAVPVSSSADVAQCAIELCGKGIDVLAQVVDNLTRPGFALIARKASENNVPVYVFDSDQMKDGGVICLARDYYDAGLEAAEKAVRILRGEDPKDIPFTNTRSEKLILNPELAKRYKLRLSDELREKAAIYASRQQGRP